MSMSDWYVIQNKNKNDFTIIVKKDISKRKNIFKLIKKFINFLLRKI